MQCLLFSTGTEGILLRSNEPSKRCGKGTLLIEKVYDLCGFLLPVPDLSEYKAYCAVNARQRRQGESEKDFTSDTVILT
jgi:hypothetical protein